MKLSHIMTWNQVRGKYVSFVIRNSIKTVHTIDTCEKSTRKVIINKKTKQNFSQEKEVQVWVELMKPKSKH